MLRSVYGVRAKVVVLPVLTLTDYGPRFADELKMLTKRLLSIL